MGGDERPLLRQRRERPHNDDDHRSGCWSVCQQLYNPMRRAATSTCRRRPLRTAAQQRPREWSARGELAKETRRNPSLAAPPAEHCNSGTAQRVLPADALEAIRAALRSSLE